MTRPTSRSLRAELKSYGHDVRHVRFVEFPDPRFTSSPPGWRIDLWGEGSAVVAQDAAEIAARFGCPDASVKFKRREDERPKQPGREPEEERGDAYEGED